LLDLIIRRRREPLDRLRLDAIDFGLDLSNFPWCLIREESLRARNTGVQGDSDDAGGDRSEHGPCVHCFHCEPPRSVEQPAHMHDNRHVGLRPRSLGERRCRRLLPRLCIGQTARRWRRFRGDHQGMPSKARCCSPGGCRAPRDLYGTRPRSGAAAVGDMLPIQASGRRRMALAH
jgi:hypothetical protein